MKPNISKHPCAGKCTEFKDEQCKTCLVQVNITQTCIDCGSNNLYKGGEIKEPKMCIDCFASMTGFTSTGKGFVEKAENEYLPTHKSFDVDFLPGDVVVLSKLCRTFYSNDLFEVKGKATERLWSIKSKNHHIIVASKEIRPATVAEIQANRRLTEAEQALAEVS